MSKQSTMIAFVVIGVLALLVRFAMLHKFGVIVEPDTAQYRAVAEGIRSGDLSADPGFRVPGFPLLLALTGMKPMLTVAVQILLALGSFALLFDASRFVLKNDRWAAIVTGIYACWPMYAQYDISLLSESLSTSLTIAAVWACVKFIHSEQLKWLAVGGILAGLATLTRPNILVLSAMLPFWGYLALSAPRNVRWARFGVALLPALVLIGGWSAFNKSRFGVFNVTTIGGFAMTDITGDIMADMPKGEGPLLDTYQKTSAEYYAKNKTRISAVWTNLDVLQKAAGVPLPQASQQMMGYDIKAIKYEPARYLKILGKSYANFWGAPGITPFNPDSLLGKKVYSSIPGIVVKAERGMGWITRFMLYLFMIFAPWYLFSTKSEIKISKPVLAATGVVLIGLMAVKPLITYELLSLIFAVAAPISVFVGYRRNKPPMVLFIVMLAWLMSLICSIPDFSDSRYNTPISAVIFLALATCLMNLNTNAAKS